MNSHFNQATCETAATMAVDDAHQMTESTAPNLQRSTTEFGPGCFLNRELSWINFNRRVLSEASNPRTPLLERVKFLAIVSANTDEFYMKRVGALKQHICTGVVQKSVDGRTPNEQLEQCRAMLLTLQKDKDAIYYTLLDELFQNKIQLCTYSELEKHEKLELQRYYEQSVRPLITPLVVDQHHPFPFISNLSLNLLIAMKRDNHSGVVEALIKIPTCAGVPRFVQIGPNYKFVLLEELIISHIDTLFPCSEIISSDVFRVTRNAITESDNSGMEDMLEMIESELRARKFGPVVRLQTSTSMHTPRKKSLATQLGLDVEKDVIRCAAMVNMSDLMEIAALDVPNLHDTPNLPINNVIIESYPSIFKAIRAAGTILLQHPYESFVTSVERFVGEASRDPNVEAIKMTLYRTSADTKILNYLMNAARNGKQVTVIVELKARFDEEANIRWATQLERAGVHVTYGVSSLKTHCKTVLVIRKENNGLHHYSHIGTGNYHAGTARLYSDIGLLTCDPILTTDLAELFNYLTTSCNARRNYKKILAAPQVIKNALLAKIEREISKHSNKLPGLIRLKTNALEDPDIIAALYKASNAGVKIELIVRDICRLKPGIENLSKNIHVISIVGRFLEHSRIYYFQNGGDEEYYIGSADLMKRNLERRVELLIPIDNADVKQGLNEILKEQLSDNYCAWDMQLDGQYIQREPTCTLSPFNCQESAISHAKQRARVAQQVIKSDSEKLGSQWLRLCF